LTVDIDVIYQPVGDFRKKTCFARRKKWNLALRSGSLFGSTPKMSRSARFARYADERNVGCVYHQRVL